VLVRRSVFVTEAAQLPLQSPPQLPSQLPSLQRPLRPKKQFLSFAKHFKVALKSGQGNERKYLLSNFE
jgi:hypothetical protein